MLQLTCETEPVTNTEKFIEFGEKVSGIIFQDEADKLEKEEMVEELTEVRAKLGENITVKDHTRLVGDKKVGVVIDLEVEDKSKASDIAIDELAKNLTLQIASLAPRSISEDDLDPEFVKSELELIKSMLKEDPKNKNKPENILEMIVQGRKGKILADVCLLEQEYVKDKMQVKELIANVEKQAGTKIAVKKFVRYQIG